MTTYITSPGDPEKITAAIRAAKKNDGSPMTQYGVAMKSGLSRSTVSAYVKQVRKPAAGSLLKLARALNIDVRELL